MVYGCFDCFRIGTACDRHYHPGYNCWDCGQHTPKGEARQFADHMYCPDCYDFAVEGSAPRVDQEDTPSLADTNPEGHMYITNRNGYGY